MKKHSLIFLLCFCAGLFGESLQAQTLDAETQINQKGYWILGLHLGGGYDFKQTTNPENVDYIFQENSFDLLLSNPIAARVALGYRFKNNLSLSTGLGVVTRAFRVTYNDDTPQAKLGLRHTVYNLPLDLSYRIPLQDKFFLEFGLGVSLDWSGSSENFDIFEPYNDPENEGVGVLFSSDAGEGTDRFFSLEDEGVLQSLYRRVFVGLQYQLNEKIEFSSRIAFNFSDSRAGRVGQIKLLYFDVLQEDIEPFDLFQGGFLTYNSLFIDVGLNYRLGK